MFQLVLKKNVRFPIGIISDVEHKIVKCGKIYFFSRITIISATSLEILHEILPNDENRRDKLGPVRVCRFSPDGKMLAKGHDTGVIEVRLNVMLLLSYSTIYHPDIPVLWSYPICY